MLTRSPTGALSDLSPTCQGALTICRYPSCWVHVRMLSVFDIPSPVTFKLDFTILPIKDWNVQIQCWVCCIMRATSGLKGWRCQYETMFPYPSVRLSDNLQQIEAYCAESTELSNSSLQNDYTDQYKPLVTPSR